MVRLAGVGVTREEGMLAGQQGGLAGCQAQSTLSETATEPGAAVLKGWSLVSGPAASLGS